MLVLAAAVPAADSAPAAFASPEVVGFPPSSEGGLASAAAGGGGSAMAADLMARPIELEVNEVSSVAVCDVPILLVAQSIMNSWQRCGFVNPNLSLPALGIFSFCMAWRWANAGKATAVSAATRCADTIPMPLGVAEREEMRS